MPSHKEILAKAALLAKQRQRHFLKQAEKRRIYRAYRTVFFDGDAISPAGLIVLGDLAEVARMGRSQTLSSDNDIRQVEGMRHLWLHLVNRFDFDETGYLRLAENMEEKDYE